MEDTVWADILGFLEDPGPVLEKLAESLNEGIKEVRDLETERLALQQSIASKEKEKDTILDLYRRERITMAHLDRQFEKIAVEEADLTDRLAALDARSKSHQEVSARLTTARELLHMLRQRVTEDFSWEQKRELVELLVSEIGVATVGEGRSKRAEVTVTYAFDGRAVNRTGTGSVQVLRGPNEPCSDGEIGPPASLFAPQSTILPSGTYCHTANAVACTVAPIARTCE